MEFLLQNIIYVYVGGGFLFLGFLWMALSPSLGMRSKLDERMNRVKGSSQIAEILTVEPGDVNIRLGGNQSLIEKILTRVLPKTDLLRNRLERTGYNLTFTKYGLICFFIGLIVYFVLTGKFAMPPVVAALFALGGGLKMTNIIINFLVARRTKKFIASFPDAIDLMVRGIKSGLPISQTVQSVCHEIDGPVGDEFTMVTDAMKLGTDLHEALWARAKKLEIPELKFFCIALSIQQETGGNLAETLGNLATILRRRKQMKLKIKAMSSEAKASAIIIGSLPFVMYLILKLISPEYIEPLLGDPRGVKMALGGLSMIGMGIFVMTKMVSFEI